MRIDVFTIFPALVEPWMDASLIGKARRAGVLDLRVHDLRSLAVDPHRSVDDTTFGGGPGMVLAPSPVFDAVEAVGPPRPLYLLSPAGRRFDQAMASALSATEGFSLLCGRYEGVDQRIADHLVDGELSIGDFVLAGGEVAALAIVEAVARLVPGVMGNVGSADEETFGEGLLEYPQYTRPADFRGWVVPDVLRSGDHGRIGRWRRAHALARTRDRRPDLFAARGGLSEPEMALVAEFGLSDVAPAKLSESAAAALEAGQSAVESGSEEASDSGPSTVESGSEEASDSDQSEVESGSKEASDSGPSAVESSSKEASDSGSSTVVSGSEEASDSGSSTVESGSEEASDSGPSLVVSGPATIDSSPSTAE